MFFFFIFAIFGVQQFQGQSYQFCRATEEALFEDDGNFIEWIKLGEVTGDDPVLCRRDSDCLEAFPDAITAICGNVYDKYGIDPIKFDNIRNIELVMYGIPGFNSLTQAFLTIFQVFTLESWVNLMYNYGDTGNTFVSILFFMLLVLMGAFFTLNLVLAIVVDSFNQSQEDIEANKTSEESMANDIEDEKTKKVADGE